MAVHNGAAFLEEAVDSVLGQTVDDLEVVAVDDASTDATPEILSRLAARDGRLRVLRLAENLRLPGALNHGLKRCRGTFVARMDADDVSEPGRLEIQRRFLQRNPDVALVGCGAMHIDATGRRLEVSSRAQTAYSTRWMCRFGMPFRHPTFMFRRALMPFTYDPARTLSEDYDLVARLTEVRPVACLPDVLLRYRIHGGALSSQKQEAMRAEARDIAVAVQRSDLSTEVFAALAPFRAAYFDLERPREPAAFFEGLRMMLEEDLRGGGASAAWLRRQILQLATQALLRVGYEKSAVIGAFAGAGRFLLPTLPMQFLEKRGALPRRWRSVPDVWARKA